MFGYGETIYIVSPTIDGAASCPLLTPVEKVNATCKILDVLGVDLGQFADSGCWRSSSPAWSTGHRREAQPTPEAWARTVGSGQI